MKMLFRAEHPAGLLRPALVLAQLLALGLLSASCGSSTPSEQASGSQSKKPGRVQQALAGVDGDHTVFAAGTVLNRYTTLATLTPADATSIGVTDVAELDFGGDALSSGDLLMIVQMQGADINTANDDATWGTVSSLNGAGLYELVEVLSVNAGTNTITLSCALKNVYSVSGATQVVRVPQYDTLTIANGGSVTAPPWDGSVGGIVAIHAQSAVSLAGTIDVSGLGFRGGAAEDSSTGASVDSLIFASPLATLGGLKGEGVAGALAEYGRAPAANGGGGGNAHNAGGGGGANGRFGATWTGLGIFDPDVIGAAAWLLDPRNTTDSSEGGGRGGYSYSSSAGDALSVAPGNAAWGGNNRRERGGLGGHPVDNDPRTRLFAGGGGGAGDGNNGHAARGGNGGGIVLLIADSITGSGQIRANGEAGESSNSTLGGSASGDAPGGGGGGGTVILHGTTISGVSVQARGGVGGNQIISNGNECEGPGGGGGGGYVFSTGAVTTDVVGALGGTTNCTPLTEFPTNGATRGGAGQAVLNGTAALPYCVDAAAPDTAIDSAPPNLSSSATGTFTFSSPDTTAVFECSLDAAAFSSCQGMVSAGPLSDGSHTFMVRARDGVGNVDPSPATHTWVIDTTAPETEIVTSPPSPTSDPTGDFTFSSPDSTASFQCSMDEGAFADCDTPFETSSLAAGSHTLQVRAVDAAGNLDPTPASHTWTVALGDSDLDGLLDGDEVDLGTDPNDADTDDDGVSDGAEVDPSEDTDGDGLINALDPDSDNDGLFDGTELGLGCDHADTDDTRGFCRADSDPSTTTSPVDPDTDDGGVSDGSEDFDLNGEVDSGETDPTSGHGADDAVVTDTDGDGLSDGTEATLGSDPNDADSDDDGVLDGKEANPGADSDGDGFKNVLDPDSDDDGLFDGTEMGLGCGDPATDSQAEQCIADADAGQTKTFVLVADTDRGGVADGVEDSNHDGAIDSVERDPNDPLDDDLVPGGGEGGAGGQGGGGGEGGAAGAEAGSGPAGSGGAGEAGASAGDAGDDAADAGAGGGGEAGSVDPGSGGTLATGGATASGGRAGTPDPTADEDTVVLGGGLCSYRPSSPARSSLGLLVFALAFACRRRQRSRKAAI